MIKQLQAFAQRMMRSFKTQLAVEEAQDFLRAFKKARRANARLPKKEGRVELTEENKWRVDGYLRTHPLAKNSTIAAKLGLLKQHVDAYLGKAHAETKTAGA